jgi:hypothetical protein
MKAITLSIVVAMTACNGSKPEPSKSEAMQHTPCGEYIAAYDHCFDKLSAQTRAVGDKNLAAAKEQMRAGANDAELQAHCTQAKKLIESACQ